MAFVYRLKTNSIKVVGKKLDTTKIPHDGAVLLGNVKMTIGIYDEEEFRGKLLGLKSSYRGALSEIGKIEGSLRKEQPVTKSDEPESLLAKDMKKDIAEITGNPEYDIEELLKFCSEGSYPPHIKKAFEMGYDARGDKE